MTVRILVGDALTMLGTLPDESVQTCVTSPPYWGLRDYGMAGQIGLEATPDLFVSTLVEVFRAVRRVLRKDGTLWVNLGDSYVAKPNSNRHTDSSTLTKRRDGTRKRDVPATGRIGRSENKGNGASDMQFAPHRASVAGLKSKDLVGIPWRVAFALQADGWYLRSEIIWHKPSVMPESVSDRPTRSHEYLFLLTRSPRYYYDAEAILEPCSPNTHMRVAQNVAAQIGSERANGGGKTNGTMKAVVRGAVTPKSLQGTKGTKNNESMSQALSLPVLQRNKRSVWTIPNEGFKDAHFATYPPALVEPCVLAGSKPGDMVLDPFSGAGTTGLVADRLHRNSTLIELNPEYATIAEKRIRGEAGMFADVEVA